MKGSQAGLAFLLAISSPMFAFAGQVSPARAISESKYSTAHSLGDNYSFDPRDGWQSVNVTNLDYKYRRRSEILNDRADKKKSGLGDAITGVVNGIWKGLKGIGPPEPVIITWYTGHDLQNPSCWADGKWAPTDASFAAALTLDGWSTRPKCFKFLELCNTHKKCVFVRVVDTCAGCAPGSKHVDLTRAAFGQLADFDVGVLTVQFRQATEPDQWYEKLWGPQVKGNKN
ncbi:RlpA-like double-psi beta-barrel-protein domain-containing protein-containing protein [Flammula alnicola]|nr:RlpA-like double-psi beta-barrel-protein domain-containing protein-containing protein [Flammula alnicola]